MNWLEGLTPIARTTMEALFNCLWQGLLLCGMVGCAMALARRINAATRCAVWWVTMVAVALLPLVETAPVRRSVDTRISVVMPEPSRKFARTVAPLRATTNTAPAIARTPAVASNDRRWIIKTPILARPAPVATVHVRNRWPLALFCIWIAGLGVMLSRLGWSFLHVRRLRRDATPLDAFYQNRLREWLDISGGPRRVGLCAVEGISTPISVGPLAPLILMPAGFIERLNEQEFDQVLLHELAHVRRGDNWINLIQKFVEALLFFHPAVWFAARRVNLERETACDDWVVDRTGAAKPYAACLAKLVEVASPLPQPILATGIFRGARQISTRIERLLDRRRNRTPRVSRWALAPALVGLACALAIGSETRAVLAGPAAPATLARMRPVVWANSAQIAATPEKSAEPASRLMTHDLASRLRDVQKQIAASNTQEAAEQLRALQEDMETLRAPENADQAQALPELIEGLRTPESEERFRALEEQVESLQAPEIGGQQAAEASEQYLALLKQIESLPNAGTDAVAAEKLLQAQKGSAGKMQLLARKSLKFFDQQLLASQEALRHVADWNFQESNGWWNGLNVRTKGQIEFADDDSDVKSVSPDGHLTIEERRGWTTRKYEVTSRERRYLVNGRSQPIDNDARAWLAEVLPHVIRDSGVGADTRVKRILKQHGPSGVLDEIAKISSDHAKCVYFEELFANGPLPTDLLKRAARQMGHEVGSDGEKARLLQNLADPYLKDASARVDYFDAIGTIGSDGEHRRVLSAVLQKDSRNRDTLLLTLKSAARIASDGEKGRILAEAADAPAFDDSVSAEFLHAVNTVASDGEHARVLMALMRSSGPSKETLVLAMKSAARIGSDGEKSRVLARASEFYLTDGGVRSAFFHAAATIASDGEHGRVLSALLAKTGLDKETFLEIIRSAARIASDGEKARVLRQVAALCPGDDAIVAALMQAVETISSDGEYRRVMSAMMGRSEIGSKLGKIKYI